MCACINYVSFKIIFTNPYCFDWGYFGYLDNKKAFLSRRQSHEDKEDQEYYESLYQDYQNQDSDVIDVDYKVVDEHENPHQQS